jgi:glycine cleavage system aminomethyltransferase T
VSFEFLAPDSAVAFAGSTPPRRSQIESEHVDQDANLAQRAGWNVVTDYGDPDRERSACATSVGVADLSCLGKIEFQADPATTASIVSSVAGGAALELGSAKRHQGTWWCPVTAGRVLAVTQPEDTARVLSSIEEAAAGSGFASVTELTAALGSNAIVGPLAREAFARATALDMRPEHFPDAAFAPVSVARTPGMVLNEGGDRYLHLFRAGYAQYNWTVFEDAARGLGGRGVGLAALGLLQGATRA